MKSEVATLQVLSGLGAKQAAAILIEYRGRKLLLDAGGPLSPQEKTDWSSNLMVDAIIISHDHYDHIGAVGQLPVDIPLYCTDLVAHQLPAGRQWHALPRHGEIQIEGISIRTGGNGHSLGGVWLHLAINGGLFYSGDFCLESTIFHYDAPPPAKIALLDSSYGLYNRSQRDCQQAIIPLLSQPTLFPVPASGRAAEMLIWLTQQGITDYGLDHACFHQLCLLLDDPQIDQRMRKALSRCLTARAHFNGQQAFVLAETPDAREGLAQQLSQVTPRQYQLLFTGYMPQPLTKGPTEEPPIYYQRWNVHPRLDDILLTIKQLRCERVLLLFHPLTKLSDWQELTGQHLYSKQQLSF